MAFFTKLFGKKKGAQRKSSLGSSDRQQVLDRWTRIEDLAATNRPSALREAVVEADKVVDFVLGKLYPNAETPAERLKSVKDTFSVRRVDYDNLWYAHKLRNEMVHTVGFELPSAEAKNLLKYYETALQILGVF